MFEFLFHFVTLKFLSPLQISFILNFFRKLVLYNLSLVMHLTWTPTKSLVVDFISLLKSSISKDGFSNSMCWGIFMCFLSIWFLSSNCFTAKCRRRSSSRRLITSSCDRTWQKAIFESLVSTVGRLNLSTFTWWFTKSSSDAIEPSRIFSTSKVSSFFLKSGSLSRTWTTSWRYL